MTEFLMIYSYMNHARTKRVFAESEGDAVEQFENWADSLDEFVDLIEVREVQ